MRMSEKGRTCHCERSEAIPAPLFPLCEIASSPESVLSVVEGTPRNDNCSDFLQIGCAVRTLL